LLVTWTIIQTKNIISYYYRNFAPGLKNAEPQPIIQAADTHKHVPK
jgi:hypothetical protein